MFDITPNRIPEKAILSFAQMGNPMFEFKIEQHHNDFFLILVVDCEKMDKNSGKFDSEYKDALVDDSLTGIQAFVNRPIGKIERIAEEIKKFFSVEVRVSFNFKNYKYSIYEFQSLQKWFTYSAYKNNKMLPPRNRNNENEPNIMIINGETKLCRKIGVILDCD